ncbi:MAG: translation initiation factor IF-2 [Candidatus Cryosericum sp.]|nr:translation initiation factor IF-2 [bacterium]
MKKVRIYELAKELNVKSPRMLEILDSLGVPVKGVVGTIDEETATLVKDIVDKEQAAKTEEAKPAPKAAKAASKAAPEKEKEKTTLTPVEPVVPIERPKAFTESISYAAFAKQFGLKQQELNTMMLKNGVPVRECGLLDPLDANYIARLLGENYVAPPEKYLKSFETRPPVVTVMGHVDHGKTTLLDYIRKSSVASREKGGITQKIGAYEVQVKGKTIVFIDTPGHEAFTSMRLKGSQVTDVVILVVAAEEGVKEQTLEALDHARAAKVPIIVAMNKIDKPEANPERVKQQLADRGLQPDDWGGDTVFLPVSAKTGKGVDELLDIILLQAEMAGLKTRSSVDASGSVIEARVDKNIGVLARLLVQTGTLHVGDDIRVGDCVGKIKRMTNEAGVNLREAKALMPVEVMGLSELPEAGEVFYTVGDVESCRMIIDEKRQKERLAFLAQEQKKPMTLDELFTEEEALEKKKLTLILKADSLSTLDAVKFELKKVKTKTIPLEILHEGTGGITKSDVLLASASNAVIVGFNVVPLAEALKVAAAEKVQIRTYDLIFELGDSIDKMIAGLTKPVFEEVVQGRARIKDVFKITGVGAIAGCLVEDGKIIRGAKARVVRNAVVIYANSSIASLKRFKEDAKEVLKGYECGVGLQNFNDFKVDDIIETLVMEEKKP